MRSRFAERPEPIVPRTLKQLLAAADQEQRRRRPRKVMIARRVT
ncbi:hypothetical protein [Actinomadura sp. 21ATH]